MRDDTKLLKFQTQSGETLPKKFVQSIVNENGSVDVNKTRKFFSEAGLIACAYDTDLLKRIMDSAHLIIAYYKHGGQFYK